jgi:hypothetical protein
MIKVNLMDALVRSRPADFDEHAAKLQAWAAEMKRIKTALAAAQAKGDVDAAEELEREHEVWFWERPTRECE